MRSTRIFFFLLLGLLPGLLMSGCSTLNCTPAAVILGGQVNLVRLADTIADTLIERSFPPLVGHQEKQPVLVTTFVNNNDLSDSSDFGRTIQSHVASRFVQQGIVVKETKMGRELLIKPGEGEFMLSRSLHELADKQSAQGVVVGTYTLAQRTLYLSVRLVNPVDQTIRATYDKKICLDDATLRLFGFQVSDTEDIDAPRQSFLDKILY